VFLLVTAQNTSEELTPEQERKRDENTKLKMLQLAELTKADMPEQPESEEAKKKREEAEKSGPGYLERLVMQIVDNVQVYIDRVHVRYEDAVSTKKGAFAVGITLDHIHMQSTDAEWKPTFLTVGSAVMYKLLTVRNLAAYFHTKPTLLSTDEAATRTPAEFARRMTELIYTDERRVEMQYVVRPISCDVRANVNKSAEDQSRPRITLEVMLDELGLVVDPGQFHSFMDVLDMVQAYQSRIKYRHYKPPRHVRPSEDPRLWWQFAITTVRADITDRNRRWRWASIKLRASYALLSLSLCSLSPCHARIASARNT